MLLHLLIPCVCRKGMARSAIRTRLSYASIARPSFSKTRLGTRLQSCAMQDALALSTPWSTNYWMRSSRSSFPVLLATHEDHCSESRPTASAFRILTRQLAKIYGLATEKYPQVWPRPIPKRSDPEVSPEESPKVDWWESLPAKEQAPPLLPRQRAILPVIVIIAAFPLGIRFAFRKITRSDHDWEAVARCKETVISV